jgi:hypothetical protein
VDCHQRASSGAFLGANGRGKLSRRALAVLRSIIELEGRLVAT